MNIQANWPIEFIGERTVEMMRCSLTNTPLASLGRSWSLDERISARGAIEVDRRMRSFLTNPDDWFVKIRH